MALRYMFVGFTIGLILAALFVGCASVQKEEEKAKVVIMKLNRDTGKFVVKGCKDLPEVEAFAAVVFPLLPPDARIDAVKLGLTLEADAADHICAQILANPSTVPVK